MTVDNSKPNAATQAKKRWNSSHYIPVKASVDRDVAAAFKKACEANGVSMNSQLVKFIAEYSNAAIKNIPKPNYSTRRQRRTAVRHFVKQMEEIKAAEEQCRDNIPENLQGSEVYDKAEEYISLLEDAIDQLESIY